MGAGTKFPNGVGADTSNYIDEDGVNAETANISGATTINGVLTATGGVKATNNVVVLPKDDATLTISADNSGKTHIVPDLDADTVASLPSAAEGLYYKFIVCTGAEDAHDLTIDTGSDTNYFIGGITGLDDDDGDILVIYPDGDSNSKVKIDTMNAGSTIELYCDGTNWYIWGLVVSGTDTHSAFSDQ